MTKIELEDGKYTITYDQGILKAFRYGDEWRDMTGDKLMGAMVDHIDVLETQINRLVWVAMLAIKQNSHDMVMTGDELRTCQEILDSIKG